jgi:hypothetical protein
MGKIAGNIAFLFLVQTLDNPWMGDGKTKIF